MLKYKLSQIGKISEKVLSKVSKIDCIFLFGELFIVSDITTPVEDIDIKILRI